MLGSNYACAKGFLRKKTYHIQRDVKEMIYSDVAGTASQEMDVMRKYRFIQNDIDKMTMVWKTRSIEPVIMMWRDRNSLIVIYNFTSLGKMTCVAGVMFACSFSVTNWRSVIVSPWLILWPALLLSWFRAVHVARCVDSYFRQKEACNDETFNKIR